MMASDVAHYSAMIAIFAVLYFFFNVQTIPSSGYDDPLRPQEQVQTFHELNDRPIVGVACQETHPDNPLGDTYIAVPHVKFLEMAGARVVPIRAGEPYEYYEDIFSKINGALFPGGRVGQRTSYLSRTARILMNLSMEAAQSGEIFPIWGSCLGFQLFGTVVNGKNPKGPTDARDLNIPLELEPGWENSRMFKHVPKDVLNYLLTEPVSQNHHKWGLLLDDFNKYEKLKKFYRVLSTNLDKSGQRFISTFEAYDYPIYASQWHPEKTSYHWDTRYWIDHGDHAVKVMQYFANFLVNEARKSSHRFPSPEEEIPHLINNFNKYYYTDLTYMEKYFFNYTQSAREYVMKNPNMYVKMDELKTRSG